MKPRVLLDGLAMPESPRWHDGRLWFSNWGTREIVAVDLDGNSEVVAEGPDGLGWATGWLPDGRMLVTGPELIRVEHDGSRVRLADLSHISRLGWSELTVDGRGNAYVNTINFDFAEFEEVPVRGRAARGRGQHAGRRHPLRSHLTLVRAGSGVALHPSRTSPSRAGSA